MPNTTALVLCGAECVWDDVDALEAMLGHPWPGVVIIVNDMGYKKGHNGRRWDGPVHHWATLHAEKLTGWKAQRGSAGLDKDVPTWSSVRRTVVDHHFQGWTNGSSGLYAVSVARLALKHPRVIGCGVPMDGRQNSFSQRAWTSHSRYRKGWMEHEKELRGHFRSMSGWTRQTFGAPSVDWIGLVHLR